MREIPGGYSGSMAGRDPAELQAAVHRALSHVARVRMMDLLGAEPHTVGQLAAATGLHTNTVRGHLDVLVRAGLIVGEQKRGRRPGRPSIEYRLADPPADRESYESLATVLAAALQEVAEDPTGAAERAGRPWGRALMSGVTVDSPEQAVERVVAELEDLGFAPELRSDDASGRLDVLLHRCPFDDLARRYGDVVCSAHLGLVRGALMELDVSVKADLRPFVEPTVCLTQLTVGPPPGT
jgi:predicted ArsR family transcriptional regulator